MSADLVEIRKDICFLKKFIVDMREELLGFLTKSMDQSKEFIGDNYKSRRYSKDGLKVQNEIPLAELHSQEKIIEDNTLCSAISEEIKYDLDESMLRRTMQSQHIPLIDSSLRKYESVDFVKDSFVNPDFVEPPEIVV